MKSKTINEHKKGNGIWYSQIDNVGKTIAHFDGCKYNLRNFLNNITDKNSKLSLWFSDFNDFVLPENYVAHSKVNYDGGDTFDSNEGCKIAKQKVMEKYHRDFDNGIRDFLYELRSVEAAIQFYCDKHDIDYFSVEYPEMIKLKKYGNYYGCVDCENCTECEECCF